MVNRHAKGPRLAWMAVGSLLSVAGLLVSCEDSSTDDGELLVSDANAVLTLRVAELDQAIASTDTDSVSIKSASGVLVATASASYLWVPIAWGEPGADPSTDYTLVSVDIESDFQDQVLQVELTIDVSGTESTWCEPMRPDPVVPGRYYLPLQPSCEASDPLTGACVIDSSLQCDGYSGACREDRLTFTLWDARTTDAGGVCHDQLDDE